MDYFVLYIDIPDTKGHKLYYKEHNITKKNDNDIVFTLRRDNAYKIVSRDLAVAFANHLHDFFKDFNLFIERYKEDL